ncbi:MAG: hypothetical protein Q9180_002203 [Flavoplaca navasiana]
MSGANPAHHASQAVVNNSYGDRVCFQTQSECLVESNVVQSPMQSSLSTSPSIKHSDLNQLKIPQTASDDRQNQDDDSAYYGMNSSDDERNKSKQSSRMSHVGEDFETLGPTFSKKKATSSYHTEEGLGTSKPDDPNKEKICFLSANDPSEVVDNTASAGLGLSSSPAKTGLETANSTTLKVLETGSFTTSAGSANATSPNHEISSPCKTNKTSTAGTLQPVESIQDVQDIEEGSLIRGSKPPDSGSSVTHLAEYSSKLSTSDSSEHRVIKEEEPPEILFCTGVNNGNDDQFRRFYSNEKYPAWSDPRKTESKPSGPKIEIIRHVTGCWKGDFEQEPPKSMEENQWRKKYRHVDFSKDFRITRQHRPYMHINDPLLREAIKSLIKYDPSQRSIGDPIRIEWPYDMLMHYRKEIIQAKDKMMDESSVSDHGVAIPAQVKSIDLLLDYIQSDYETLVVPELQNYRKLRVAEFSKLWLLFRPGEEVFANVNGRLTAFIVLAYQKHEPGDSATTKAPIEQIIVHMWNLHLVAGRLVRHMSQITIDKYDGTRTIETLPVYPSKYAGAEEQAHKMRKILIQRGKKYFSIIQQPHAYMEHKGLTSDIRPRNYNGRVIIDSISYAKYRQTQRHELRHELLSSLGKDWWKLQPHREKNSVHFQPVNPSDINEPEDDGGGELWKKYIDLDPLDACTKAPGFLEDLHYLLCPSIIRGFSLKDKQWETYEVESLTDIDWTSPHDAFHGLLLDRKKKDLIRANCRSAKERRESPDLAAEQIGGKGEGTVVLLHDCVANYTKQPLLSLSGCDMGSTSDLEAYVQHWFDLARAWDAIVLLDEADIFLTYRQKNDMERNLLATNRIGQLDTAINSRIDFDINFPKLSLTAQKDLWNSFFQIVNDDSNSEDGPYIDQKTIDKFFENEKVEALKLSGRDIRNVFKQATRMARNERKHKRKPESKSFKLKLHHLLEPMEEREKRIQYILKANGAETEEQLAEYRFERQSSFSLVQQRKEDGKTVMS